MGIAYFDTTISHPIRRDPFMHIYFRKIYKFIKTIHKSSSYNSFIYKILHVKSSFFTKRFLKATVQLSSHLRSRMRVSFLYITCTCKGVPRWGEQCPVRITPTRATPHLSAHAMPCSDNNTHINIPMKNMLILNGILHVMP